MKGISIKLKYIYLRHILISVLSVFFYTYLTYLNSKHGFLEIKEEYIEFFFPILLAVIVITIWLRKPILMLDLHGIERGFFFYYLVASVSIIVPAMIAQKYLESSNEELKIIQSFEEIDRLNYYDCYKIIDFSIDKSEAAVYRNTREIGGKVSSRKYFNS